MQCPDDGISASVPCICAWNTLTGDVVVVFLSAAELERVWAGSTECRSDILGTDRFARPKQWSSSAVGVERDSSHQEMFSSLLPVNTDTTTATSCLEGWKIPGGCHHQDGEGREVDVDFADSGDWKWMRRAKVPRRTPPLSAKSTKTACERSPGCCVAAVAER